MQDSKKMKPYTYPSNGLPSLEVSLNAPLSAEVSLKITVELISRKRFVRMIITFGRINGYAV
jgi:hypothetical protein